MLNNVSFDNFCSGHLAVDAKRRVLFCNDYVERKLGWTLASEPCVNLNNLFSKASTIFIDSYVYPQLMHQHYVEEVQLTMLTEAGEPFPVVININLTKDNISYWSLFCCVNRDKLYQELIQAREQLEKQSQELFNLATVDSLTGLLNRRELNSRAERTLSQAYREGTQVALFVIDVDHFKNINDSHGHTFGDQVLKKISHIICQNRRNIDIVARFGGEEFVVVLPDVNQLNAINIAETIRLNIEHCDIDGVNITVSIGVGLTLPSERESFDCIFNRADKSLYKAKDLGRNQTVLFAD